MSQTNKVHKIQVRNKAGAEGQLTAGPNVEVLIDGVPLKGATFLKFEVGAKKVAKVMIEMVAEIDLEVQATPETQKSSHHHFVPYRTPEMPGAPDANDPRAILRRCRAIGRTCQKCQGRKPLDGKNLCSRCWDLIKK